jgi:hypothetical protein
MASPIEHLHDRLTTKCPLSGGTLEDGRSSTRRWSKFDSKMVEVRLNVRFPGGALEDGRSSTRRWSNFDSKMVELRLEDGRSSTQCPLSGGTLEDGRTSTRRWSKFDSKMVELRLEDGRTSTRRLTLMDHMS